MKAISDGGMKGKDWAAEHIPTRYEILHMFGPGQQPRRRGVHGARPSDQPWISTRHDREAPAYRGPANEIDSAVWWSA